MASSPEQASFRVKAADGLKRFSDGLNNGLMVGGVGVGVLVNPVLGAGIFVGALVDKEVITPVVDKAIRGRRNLPSRVA